MFVIRRQLFIWECVLSLVWYNEATSAVLAIRAETEDDFSGCGKEEYYQELLLSQPSIEDWGREELSQLLRDTHRRVLPYTSSSVPDVWDALIDLDSAEDPSLVQLIYRNINVSANDYGNPSTWNREHLWPKSRGVGSSGPDHTDIHALRPCDWNVNAARGNLFFGDCQDSCTRRPATDEAASDTAKNSDVFLPPTNVRGDIARALLYMELRYSFVDEQGTSVLRLTDCPDLDRSTNGENSLNQMAYLSELLEWHLEDKVDDREKMRNDKACARWQGNRNIFVDFPALAVMLYGAPSSKPYICNGSTPTPSPVEQETDPPTGTSSGCFADEVPGGCSYLSAGDVQIIGMNTDNPDSITMVALENLAPGLELYITDNAWSGTEFLSNEGTQKLKVPLGGICKGTVFGFGVEPSGEYLYLDGLWESVGSGSFALATAGDSVILYCKVQGAVDDDQVTYLGAFISGNLENDDVTDLSSNQSRLPDSLAHIGSTETGDSGWDNYSYQGITSGTKTQLLRSIGDPSNWEGSNDRVPSIGQDFVIIDEPSPSPAHCRWRLFSLCFRTVFGWG